MYAYGIGQPFEIITGMMGVPAIRLQYQIWFN